MTQAWPMNESNTSPRHSDWFKDGHMTHTGPIRANPRIFTGALHKKKKALSIEAGKLVESSLELLMTIHPGRKPIQENRAEGTSLVVQWLRLHASTAGGTVSSLAGEVRSHMPRGADKIFFKKRKTELRDGEMIHL